MPVVIDLPPEFEALLAAKAQAQGVTLPEYLRRLLEDQTSGGKEAGMSPAERAAAWRDSVRGLPDTPPLSDEAICRESIYDARG